MNCQSREEPKETMWYPGWDSETSEMSEDIRHQVRKYRESVDIYW